MPRPTAMATRTRRRREGETLLRKRASRLTPRGIVTLILGVVALIAGYSAGRHEVLVIAGFCLLLVIVGAIVVRARKPKFELIRLFAPPVVSAGGLSRVTVRVRNVAQPVIGQAFHVYHLPGRHD